MGSTVISKFINDCKFMQIDFCRVCYLRFGCDETFVFECPAIRGKCRTFVYFFNCGELEEIKTEFNTFANYLVHVEYADFAEIVGK